MRGSGHSGRRSILLVYLSTPCATNQWQQVSSQPNTQFKNPTINHPKAILRKKIQQRDLRLLVSHHLGPSATRSTFLCRWSCIVYRRCFAPRSTWIQRPSLQNGERFAGCLVMRWTGNGDVLGGWVVCWFSSSFFH